MCEECKSVRDNVKTLVNGGGKLAMALIWG